jgi:hypothetical protein
MHFLSLKRCLCLIVLIIPFITYSQNSGRVVTQEVSLQVAGSALLAVFGPAVKLQLAGSSQAGDAIAQAVEDNSTRLRMSSLVNNQERRSILAKISEPLVGTQLYVELQQPNSNFTYPENMGALKGQQLLDSESDITLVEGIGTCWSGTTEDDGYVIKYTYKAIPSAPVLKNSTITVTFTISLVPSDSESKN